MAPSLTILQFGSFAYDVEFEQTLRSRDAQGRELPTPEPCEQGILVLTDLDPRAGSKQYRFVFLPEHWEALQAKMRKGIVIAPGTALDNGGGT